MNIALNTDTQVQTFKPSETMCFKVNVCPASKATHIDTLATDVAHHVLSQVNVDARPSLKA